MSIIKQNKNRRIFVFCPAAYPAKDKLEQGVTILRQWGFDVVVGQSCNQRDPDWPYLAGPSEIVRQDFIKAFKSPIAIAGRGGYGTLRSLYGVSKRITEATGIIMGFSDITVLHAFASLKGIKTIHGPNVTTLGMLDEQNLDIIFKFLAHRATKQDLSFIIEWDVQKTITAPVFAGNLAVMASLAGGPYFPDINGKILILEEVAEPLYRIDRYMWQLYMRGVRPAALVFGELDCKDSALDYVLESAAKRWGIEWVKGLPVGHKALIYPVIQGTMYRLDNRGLYLVEEPF